MNRFLFTLMTLGLILGCTTTEGEEQRQSSSTANPQPPQLDSTRTWASYELSDLEARSAENEGPWLEFLRVPSLFSGLYQLPAGGKDRQRPHRDDEVYYIIKGRATLRVDGQDQPVKPGSIIYVKADIGHRFHSIQEDLEVLVFFSSTGN